MSADVESTRFEISADHTTECGRAVRDLWPAVLEQASATAGPQGLWRANCRAETGYREFRLVFESRSGDDCTVRAYLVGNCKAPLWIADGVQSGAGEFELGFDGLVGSGMAPARAWPSKLRARRFVSSGPREQRDTAVDIAPARTQEKPATAQCISFCVALCNRAENFHKMVKAWADAVDDHCELVVADFGSTDLHLSTVLRELGKPYRIVGMTGAFNRARGLNAAAAAAIGEILFFIDADMVVPHDFCKTVRQRVLAGWAYFPICYSLHEPGARDGNPLGWWRTSGFGMCGFTADDFRRLRWSETFTRWGKEDNDLFNRAASTLQIYRARCCGLFHQWHPDDLSFKERYHAVGRPESPVALPPKPNEEAGAGEAAIRQVARVRPVRVAFLTPSLCMGGAERWMLALAREMPSQRIQWCGVALTASGQSDARLCREMQQYMPIFAGPARAQGLHDSVYVARFSKAETAIEQVVQNADVLLTWGAICPAQYLGGRLQVVLVSHGSAPWPAALRLREMPTLHLAAVSEAAKSPFPESARSRIQVIPNGIDADRCAALISRNEVRTAWGFEPHHKLVGYIGRFSKEKNPLAAAQAVRRLGGDFRAVYVGTGRHETQTRTAADSLIGSAATFVGPMDQIGNALAALDVLVLASPYEGFSLTLAEAWFAGLPTVATRVGAVPELEQRHGPLVVPVSIDGSADELGAAVLTALSEENRATVTRAQETTALHYTSKVMAAAWSNYLCRLCLHAGLSSARSSDRDPEAG